MTPKIDDFAERSPLYDRHADAPLLSLEGRAFVARYAVAGEHAQRVRCALVDLSNLPRVGFRGAQAADYLGERGYRLPDTPNRATRQAGGESVLRLSQNEYCLLGSLADGGARIAAEEAAWRQDARACYALPRQDSHAWLALTGAHLAELMAKLCGVDLRDAAFPEGAVAQTSVARLNTIVVNAGTSRLPLFHLLCDRASAHYLWGVLLDAMDEFGGRAVGVQALLESA